MMIMMWMILGMMMVVDMPLVFLGVIMLVIWVMVLFTRMFYDCNVVDDCGCGYGYELIIIYYIE